MALKFITTGEAAKVNGIKSMAYGRSGIGKTKLCATAPDPVIFSAEAGLLSIAKYNLQAVEIQTLADLMEAYTWATESADAKKYKTLCLDSITEIAEVVLTNAKLTNKDPRNAYGELIEKMLEVIKSFRDIKGKNVLFTAKETKIKDEISGRIFFSPGMPGQQLGPGLPYYLDEVFHIDIGETPEGQKYRYLRTCPDLTCEAKDRSGVLDEIEKPDLTFVFDKIMKGISKNG